MQLTQPLKVTEVITGDECKEGLMVGVKTLHDPVASTLGASGRTVILEDKHGRPKPTKDGVTVAKDIVPLDPVERMGCEIIKQASLKTADEAGDGTTTSTIIAKAILDEGMSLMKDKKVNYTDFNKGMYNAVDMVTNTLDKLAQEITMENIEPVATISANNDSVLGEIIADAYRQVGMDGVVIMDRSQTEDTYISVTEGFELEKGYESEVFITDKDTGRVELKKPLVLISNEKIEKWQQIEPHFEYAVTNRLPIVIVAEMKEELVALLALNVAKGNFSCSVVRPSHFGIRRKELLSDLAITLGGDFIDDSRGTNFEAFFPESMGKADKVIMDKNKTIFYTKEPSEELKEHILVLKKQFKKEKNPTEKMFLKERISKISSSVATVFVGASSETEQSEKADRVDDAIHATRAALEEGIVSGGGVALHNVADILKDIMFENSAETAGFHCVLEAIKSPLKMILENGDYKYSSSDYKITGHGIDVKNRKKGDMISMKIIDPVKVTKTALKNAVSAASTLLSTTSVIVNLRKV